MGLGIRARDIEGFEWLEGLIAVGFNRVEEGVCKVLVYSLLSSEATQKFDCLVPYSHIGFQYPQKCKVDSFRDYGV